MRLKIAPFRCPCCDESILIDKAKATLDDDDLNITEIAALAGTNAGRGIDVWVAREEAARELEAERQRIRDTKGFFP